MEITLTKDNFNDTLKQGKPVLVDFWATWCGPCRVQSPILAEAAKTLGDTAIVGKVNVDEQRELAMQYDIMSIPTLAVFKDGKIVARSTGVTPVNKLIDMVNANL